METSIADLMIKVEAIAQGPNADLLRKLADVLHDVCRETWP
jgi:hypothetical protein